VVGRRPQDWAIAEMVTQSGHAAAPAIAPRGTGCWVNVSWPERWVANAKDYTLSPSPRTGRRDPRRRPLLGCSAKSATDPRRSSRQAVCLCWSRAVGAPLPLATPRAFEQPNPRDGIARMSCGGLFTECDASSAPRCGISRFTCISRRRPLSPHRSCRRPRRSTGRRCTSRWRGEQLGVLEVLVTAELCVVLETCGRGDEEKGAANTRTAAQLIAMRLASSGWARGLAVLPRTGRVRTGYREKSEVSEREDCVPRH
jgi:hypothetical protein